MLIFFRGLGREGGKERGLEEGGAGDGCGDYIAAGEGGSA